MYPTDSAEDLALGILLISAGGHSADSLTSAWATQRTASQGNSPYQEVRFTYVLGPSQLAQLLAAFGPTIAELEAAVDTVAGQLRANYRTTFTEFGPAGCLRIQYARLGSASGVPFIHFSHEDTVGSLLHQQGEWENLQTELLQAFLKPGDVVADIGAHVGSHTVALAASVAPGGTAHAFEVQGGVVDVLHANAALAGFSDVMQVHHAIVDAAPAPPRAVRRVDYTQKENLFLALPGSGLMNNIGGYSLMPAYQQHWEANDTAGEEATELVPVVSIDSLGWHTSGHCPTLLKLDVEGGEMGVLQGAAQTLAACRPVLHVENNQEGDASQSRALLSWLEAHDYSCFWETSLYSHDLTFMGRGRLKKEGDAGPRISVNLLAVPSGFEWSSLPPRSRYLTEVLFPANSSFPRVTDFPYVPVVRRARTRVVLTNHTSGADGPFHTLATGPEVDIVLCGW